MVELGRRRGESVEIAGCALVEVVAVEPGRVQLAVTAPFSRSSPAERAGAARDTPGIVVKVLAVEASEGEEAFQARLGVSVPPGVRLAPDTAAEFPWHRYHPTGRYWRDVDEAIIITTP